MAKRKTWTVGFNLTGRYINDFELEMRFPDSAVFSASETREILRDLFEKLLSSVSDTDLINSSKMEGEET